MKSTTILAAALLPATALSRFVSKRDDVTTTDTYLFSTSLEQFVAYRDTQDPATLDWTSDACTSSPDNPLGFDFEPACYRHDFGYNNYRLQSRFTKAAKASIDSNFLEDLKYQCESEIFQAICNALAEVYYTAVKAFGGEDATKRSQGSSSSSSSNKAAVAEYEAKVAAYDAAVAEAQAKGELERRADPVAEYEEKLAAYNALVAEAKANGTITE